MPRQSPALGAPVATEVWRFMHYHGMYHYIVYQCLAMFSNVYHMGKFVGLEHHLYSGLVQQQFIRLVRKWHFQTALYLLPEPEI